MPPPAPLTTVAPLPRRPVGRALLRLRVRRRRDALDAALAGGRSPWTSPALHLRAEQLTALAHRRALARALLAMVELAGHPRRAAPTFRLRHRAVLHHRETLEVLALRLAQPAPVDVAVVARLRMLAWDRASPVYTVGRPVHELPRTLGACLTALAE